MSMPRTDNDLAYAALLALGVAAVALVLFLALGCAPKRPDSSLVLWEQPAPEVAAKAHAKERGLVAMRTAGTSMQPMIAEGDWVVLDAGFPFAKLRAGDVILYTPDWSPDSWVLHACAEKSGAAWIVHGLNNAHYENGPNGGLHVYSRHYRAKLVQAYTKRAKT